MIHERAFERLLGLDECRAVVIADYETEPAKRFLLVLREMQKLWTDTRSPVKDRRPRLKPDTASAARPKTCVSESGAAS